MIINRRYEIIKKLGEGRSQIFLVKDNYYPKNEFAMKILSHNAIPSEIQNFKDEYYLLKSINHSCIVKPYFNGTVRNIIGDNNYNICENDIFYTMEFVRGKNLSEIEHDILIRNFETIITQIASVLFYLHQSNLIYFDLKPENILLDINDEVKLKFIDFGFTEEFSERQIESIKGSPFLISPEILNHEIIDQRSDIYSLGILIYWILFSEYPFTAEDELDIYKQHISSKISFPENKNIDNRIKFVIEKATEKKPEDRFENVLFLLNSIKNLRDINPNEFTNVYKYFYRSEIEKNLSKFLDSSNSHICLISGDESSGKSKLIENIKRKVKNAVIAEFRTQIDVLEKWKRIVVELLLVESIKNDTRNSLLNYFENNFNESEENITEIIITIFSKISQESELIFLIDDYDQADEFSIEVIKKLLNVLSINKRKTIITSKQEQILSDFEKKTIKITPLNEDEIDEFIEHSFYKEYPKKDLSLLIKKYADKNYGSINNFIRELLSVGVISYTDCKPVINISKEFQEKVADRIIFLLESKSNLLNHDQLEILKLISAFEQIDEVLIATLLNIEPHKVESLLDSLEKINLLYSRKKILDIKFIAESYKNFFYGKIENQIKFHNKIAGQIINDSRISIREKLIHLEKSKNYSLAVKLILAEIKILQTISAFTSMANYYSRLIAYPISDEDKINIKVDFLDILIKMNDIKKAELILQEIETNREYVRDIALFNYLKGMLLYKLGDVNEALKIFNNEIAKNEKNNFHIKIEIANICIDLADYKKLYSICEEIINNRNASPDIVGKAYNFMALGKIYEKNDFASASELFEKSINIYEKTNNKSKIAGIELNLGNALNALGDSKSAFEHWEKAQLLNQNIGNFAQEANALQNLGIYYFQNFDYENAIEKYLRSLTIFETIGDKSGLAIIYFNIAECKLFAMEFQEANKFLSDAIETFKSVSNEDGLLDSYCLASSFWIKTDDINQLKKAREIISQKSEIAGFHNYLIYLDCLITISESKSALKSEELKKVLDALVESKNLFLLFDLALVISNHQLFDLINESLIPFLENEEGINQTEYIKALTSFLKGKIAGINEEKFSRTAIEYFFESYEKLSHLSVSELTLRVVYEISKFFITHGNYWKAKEFLNYTISIIDYISSEIRNDAFKAKLKKANWLRGILEFIKDNDDEFSVRKN